jgi:hypothetical protein
MTCSAFRRREEAVRILLTADPTSVAIAEPTNPCGTLSDANVVPAETGGAGTVARLMRSPTLGAPRRDTAATNLALANTHGPRISTGRIEHVLAGVDAGHVARARGPPARTRTSLIE